jgi:DCN1-like protein 1/2
MRAMVPGLRQSFISDEETFKRVYKFTFGFARTGNQKGLSLDVAIEYWKLLFGDRFATHIDAWTEFLETVWKKSINKDTWNCMYDFVQLASKDPQLTGYDIDGKAPL